MRTVTQLLLAGSLFTAGPANASSCTGILGEVWGIAIAVFIGYASIIIGHHLFFSIFPRLRARCGVWRHREEKRGRVAA